MKIQKRYLVTLAAGAMLAASSLSAQTPSFFRIGTGGAGGTYFPIGGTIVWLQQM